MHKAKIVIAINNKDINSDQSHGLPGISCDTVLSLGFVV